MPEGVGMLLTVRLVIRVFFDVLVVGGLTSCSSAGRRSHDEALDDHRCSRSPRPPARRRKSRNAMSPSGRSFAWTGTWQLRDEGEPADPRRLAELAIEFEAVALAVPDRGSDALREIEGRAWMRAAECHFELVDSVRAEIILANARRELRGPPAIFGEVSLPARPRHRAPRSVSRRDRPLQRRRRTASHRTPGPDPKVSARPGSDRAGRENRGRLRAGPPPPHRATRGPGHDGAPTGRMLRGGAPLLLRTEWTTVSIRPNRSGRPARGSPGGPWQSGTRRRPRCDLIEDRIPGDRDVAGTSPPKCASLRSNTQIRACRFGGRNCRFGARARRETRSATTLTATTAPSALLAMANARTNSADRRSAPSTWRASCATTLRLPLCPKAQLLRARLYRGRTETGVMRERVLQAIATRVPDERCCATRAPGDRRLLSWHSGTAPVNAHALDVRGRDTAKSSIATPRATQLHHPRKTRLGLRSPESAREAVNELLAMCDAVAQPAQRPGLLCAAASRTELQLGEPARAATIYQRLADEFPNTRLGPRRTSGSSPTRRLAQESEAIEFDFRCVAPRLTD